MTPHLTDDLAQSLADGALDPARREGCEAHLAACGDCRLLVESWRALAAELDGLALAAPEPAPDFTAGVLARIDAVEHHRRRERRVAAGVLAAAALLALGAFGLAGAGAWAPALSGLGRALGGAVRAVAFGADLAAPVVRALRVQILLACLALGLPLLLALRRLAEPRPAEAVVAR